jgi:hypothetical protein
MTSQRTAQSIAFTGTCVDEPASGTVPMVEVKLHIRADTLAQIDAFCEATKPLEMPRERMLLLMVQTGILYWESKPNMSSAVSPRGATIKENMDEASFPAVLLYGLTLDDEDPATGVALGVRRELGLIASLAETATPGIDFNLAEMAPVLETLGRRLDVAIELMARAKQSQAEREPRSDATRDGAREAHARD